MGHVFISHSHADKDYAAALADDILQHGFDVWIDDRIEYGDRWLDAIFKAITEASAVVVIMSPASQESEWVQKEYLYAKELEKLLLPLQLDGHVFPYFVNVQYGTFTAEGGLPDDFYERLKEVVTPGQGLGKIVSRLTTPHVPHSRRRVRKAPAWLTWIIPLVTIVVAVIIGFIVGGLWSGDDDPTPAPTPTRVSSPGMVTFGTTTHPTKRFGDLYQYDMLFTSIRDSNMDIYAMAGDGNDLVRLTTDPAHDDYAMWSPDGTQIVFVSDRDGDPDIFVMDTNGNNPHNLTNDASEDYNPAWSPDGTQIAFHSDRSGDYDVWVMNADGSNLHNVTNNPAVDRSPVWTTDGLRLIFDTDRDGNDEIYAMNADGTNPVNLTDNPADDQLPTWSPTSTRIAFMTDRDGNWEIYLMSPDGADPRNLTNNPAFDKSPTWSANGIYLAYVSDRDGLWDIYVRDSSSDTPMNITEYPSASDFSPEWRSDFSASVDADAPQ